MNPTMGHRLRLRETCAQPLEADIVAGRDREIELGLDRLAPRHQLAARLVQTAYAGDTGAMAVLRTQRSWQPAAEVHG